MKALILAAGRGSRLASARRDLPKPLVDVCGTTPLEHAVDWVVVQRPTRVWINVHTAAALVEQRIGSERAGVPILFSYEPELLGTAGAWKNLEAEWDSTSLVVYGDNLMRFDLDAFEETHRTAGTLATVAVFDPGRHRNTGPGGGRVELSGSRVTNFVEGGAHGPINAGAYLLEPELREQLPDGFLDFGHDVLPLLAAAGQLSAHILEDDAFCLGVDTPERLSAARTLMSGREAAR
jgi:mannose-1-phosphate guanylyltransferase